eukprot:GHVP01025776.1.p1 GENE.GHVP01025776.1~~GHVP01025776.1.p1  ORF type:complete len:315 (+),score=42.44 GHVP01025776.1:40-984(+)
MTLGEECKFGIVSSFMGAMTGCYTHSPLPDISDASSSQVQGENVAAFATVKDGKIYQTARLYQFKGEESEAFPLRYSEEPKFEEVPLLNIEDEWRSKLCNQIRKIYDEGIISYLSHYYEIGTCLYYEDSSEVGTCLYYEDSSEEPEERKEPEEPLLCFKRKAKIPESHPKAIAASYNKEGSFFTIYLKIGEMIFSTAFNCDKEAVYQDPVKISAPEEKRILVINEALEIKERNTYYKSNYIGDVYKSKGLPFDYADHNLYYLFHPLKPKAEVDSPLNYYKVFLREGLNPKAKEFKPRRHVGDSGAEEKTGSTAD